MKSTVKVGDRSVELPDVITSRQQFKRTFGLPNHRFDCDLADAADQCAPLVGLMSMIGV